ncbi:MAG: hypothetical protein L7W94_02095 [Alphaproteobacteria bacterium]|nr:hypothetical protein [Alphaproteobacteria bacterium]
MTLKLRRSDRRHFLAGGVALLTMALVGRAGAAGRTYKSQNEDDAPRVELCRLRRREYADGGTNCFYKRQSGGKDALIRVDDQKVRCQSEYMCKRIK